MPHASIEHPPHVDTQPPLVVVQPTPSHGSLSSASASTPATPKSANTITVAPGSSYFETLAPEVPRDQGKTPDFGEPFTRHPPGGLVGSVKTLGVPEIAKEHTEPGSDRDKARRQACQQVLDSAPVFAEGGFELETGTSEHQHPLVELAKNAIRALQIDQDPVKFADCFDEKADIMRIRLAHGKEMQRVTGRQGFIDFAKELIEHGFTCVPSPAPADFKHPISGFSLRGSTLTIPMHVHMETSTARYFPPSGLVPGLWTTKLGQSGIGHWEFVPSDGAIRRMMWGREMDGVPVLTREGGKGDEELGELVKKLARSQLMGDVETFVSCFDPEEGRMVTILDRQGKPMLRKEGQESGEAEHKVVFKGKSALLEYALARREQSAFFLATSHIVTLPDKTAECHGTLHMDSIMEHYPHGLAGVVKVKQNATTGLLEEVEFLAA